VPTYRYRCQECEKTFERTETMSEHERSVPDCPNCKSKKVSVVPSRVHVVTRPLSETQPSPLSKVLVCAIVGVSCTSLTRGIGSYAPCAGDLQLL
jgi:putative FmdB family regulatory protein